NSDSSREDRLARRTKGRPLCPARATVKRMERAVVPPCETRGASTLFGLRLTSLGMTFLGGLRIICSDRKPPHTQTGEIFEGLRAGSRPLSAKSSIHEG